MKTHIREAGDMFLSWAIDVCYTQGCTELTGTSLSLPTLNQCWGMFVCSKLIMKRRQLEESTQPTPKFPENTALRVYLDIGTFKMAALLINGYLLCGLLESSESIVTDYLQKNTLLRTTQAIVQQFILFQRCTMQCSIFLQRTIIETGLFKNKKSQCAVCGSVLPHLQGLTPTKTYFMCSFPISISL